MQIDRKKQRKNRLIITAFFLFTAIGVWTLLSYATPYVDSLRKDGVLGLVFYQVIEVSSGDTLLVKHEDHIYRVKLAGIRAPQPSWVDDPEFAGWTWTEMDLAHLASTSKKALSTWVFKRHVALEPPLTPGLEESSDEPLVVRATLSRVDLGRKQLQSGQVLQAGDAHDWKEIYAFSQDEAEQASYGLWRFAPKPL